MATNPKLRYADGRLADLVGRGDARYRNAQTRTSDQGEVNPYDYYLDAPVGGTDAYWRGLGYEGPAVTQETEQSGGGVMTPELRQWLSERGFTTGTDGGLGWSGLLDANGQVVDNSWYGNQTNDDATFIAGALGIGGFGLAANAAGVGVNGSGAATGGAFGQPATSDLWGTILSEGTPTNVLQTGAAEPAGSGIVGTANGGAGGLSVPTSAAPNALQSLSALGTGGAPAWVQPAAILGSSLIGTVGANKAAREQAAAADRASAISQAQYEQNRKDAEPWREAGIGTLGQLVSGTAPGGDLNRDFTMADFQKDPGYDFRLGEGRRGVEAGAAARGGALSGGALKALERYSQGYASNEFGNAYSRFNSDRDRRFNRLASIAGLGQTATRDVAQMGTDNARNQGEYGMQGANARASGYIGTANQLGTGLQTLGQWWNRSPSYTSPNRDGSYNNPAYDGSGSFNSTGTAFRDPIPYEG